MSSDVPQLSDRESEILTLVATGATNQQIAHQLHISPNTVKVHMRNIFSKIGAASRTEAAVYAARIGLVKVADAPDMVQQLSADVFEQLPEEKHSRHVDHPLAYTEAVEDNGISTNVSPIPPATNANSTDQPPSPSAVKNRVAPHHSSLFVPLVLVSSVLVIVVGFLLYGLLQEQSDPSQVPLDSSEVVVNSRWQKRATIPQPRDDFAVAAYDGKLYVIGGATAGTPTAAVHRYDPTNDVWVTLNDKLTPVSYVKGVTIGGSIYVPGGEDADGTVLNVLEVYDPRNQQWQTLPALPAPRSRYALTEFEGLLYLFGGWDGRKYCAEVFIFDPTTEEWREGGLLPTPRRSASAAVTDGIVYIIGGENENGSLNVNESYDPTAGSSGQWESSAPLPTAIATPAVAGLIDIILVFDPRTRLVVQYIPAKDAWNTISIPDTVALSTRVAALGTKIFIFGTASHSTPGMVSEYQAIYTIFIPDSDPRN
jgi:DNA-binding CsgD family transcriptional regulator